MKAELGLELARQLEQVAVHLLGGGQQPRQLPEVRLLLARGGAEGLRLDGAEALGEDPEAAAAEQLTGVVQGPLELG